MRQILVPRNVGSDLMVRCAVRSVLRGCAAPAEPHGVDDAVRVVGGPNEPLAITVWVLGRRTLIIHPWRVRARCQLRARLYRNLESRAVDLAFYHVGVIYSFVRPERSALRDDDEVEGAIVTGRRLGVGVGIPSGLVAQVAVVSFYDKREIIAIVVVFERDKVGDVKQTRIVPVVTVARSVGPP